MASDQPITPSLPKRISSLGTRKGDQPQSDPASIILRKASLDVAMVVGEYSRDEPGFDTDERMAAG